MNMSLRAGVRSDLNFCHINLTVLSVMNINELVFINEFDNHVVVMSEVVRLLHSYRQMNYASTEAGGT